MKKYKRISCLFWAAAWLASCVMCAVIACDWTYLTMCPSCSAPAWVSLVNAVIYLPITALCAGLALWFGKKANQNH